MTRKTQFGTDLIAALSEALAHAEGRNVPGIQLHSIDAASVDAKSIRQRLHLTQGQMAHFLGTSASGYRKWEQGQRQPSGAAKTLLRVMEREPEAVLRALVAE